jgi:hypothetical protein
LKLTLGIEASDEECTFEDLDIPEDLNILKDYYNYMCIDRLVGFLVMFMGRVVM